MSTPSLYWTRSGTSSECSSVCMSLDRPRSNFRVSLTTRGSVQHSLQPVCNDLRHPSENCIAVIHMGRQESVDECGSRLKSQVIVGCNGVVVVWRSQQHKQWQRAYQDLGPKRLWHQEDGHARWQWQCLLQAVNLVHTPQPPKSDRLCFVLAQSQVWTEPRLRPNEKFDFTFLLISGLTWF